jgi:hypothetical protein
VTSERITLFHAQVAHLRQVETNVENYRLAVTRSLAELDWMQLEVREYLSLHPAELAAAAPSARLLRGMP